MTEYRMRTVDTNGTRRRKDHNTTSTYVLPHAPAGAVIEGDELWVALVSGTYVRAGDTWLRVTKINGVAQTETIWMAYIHMGAYICKDLTTVAVGEPTPVPTNPAIPQSFIWTEPVSGVSAEYVFSRILP